MSGNSLYKSYELNLSKLDASLSGLRQFITTNKFPTQWIYRINNTEYWKLSECYYLENDFINHIVDSNKELYEKIIIEYIQFIPSQQKVKTAYEQ